MSYGLNCSYLKNCLLVIKSIAWTKNQLNPDFEISVWKSDNQYQPFNSPIVCYHKKIFASLVLFLPFPAFNINDGLRIFYRWPNKTTIETCTFAVLDFSYLQEEQQGEICTYPPEIQGKEGGA